MAVGDFGLGFLAVQWTVVGELSHEQDIATALIHLVVEATALETILRLRAATPVLVQLVNLIWFQFKQQIA